jgi:hypothetical protein
VFNKREAFNPFYLLVVVAGVAFVVTACAQAATDLKQIRPGAPAESPAAMALITWLQTNGTRALAIELAVLAVATVLAITTDGFWHRRAQRRIMANRAAQPDPTVTRGG